MRDHTYRPSSTRCRSRSQRGSRSTTRSHARTRTRTLTGSRNVVRREPQGSRWGRVLGAALILGNIGVFGYHGNPFATAVGAAEAQNPGTPAGAEPSSKSRPSSPPPTSSAPSSLSGPPVGDEVTPQAQPVLTGGDGSPGDGAQEEIRAPAEHRLAAALNRAQEQSPIPAPSSHEADSPLEGHGIQGPPPPYDPTFGLRNPGPIQHIEKVVLRRGQNAAVALDQADIVGPEVDAALGALAKVVDFRRLRPGHTFKARLGHQRKLVSMDLIQGALSQVRAEPIDGRWKAAKLDIPVDTVSSSVSGEVKSSLWGAMVEEAGETAALVHDVVDIFAWEIDFYSQIFPGDRFKVLVEKKYAEGKFVGYGDVLAAEIVSGGATVRAFVHRPVDEEGQPLPATYYDASGNSMRKQLLKAPLKYGHVTSTFGPRRHPVLGYTRAHNGTDYGVPTGTPVWSVGDGIAIKAGVHGGFGKLVEVKHPNGWVSQYAHLSRIDVKVGQRVRQKQIVGAVGSTGLSTGPHLHYGLRKNGRYVNSLTQKFEPGKSLTGDELAAFKQQVGQWVTQLDAMKLAWAQP